MHPSLEIEAATRRGARLLAMRNGTEIPFLETAFKDHESRNSPDDKKLLALLRGRARIPGASVFPPARTLETTLASESQIANEAVGYFMLGPVVRPPYYPR